MKSEIGTQRNPHQACSRCIPNGIRRSYCRDNSIAIFFQPFKRGGPIKSTGFSLTLTLTQRREGIHSGEPEWGSTHGERLISRVCVNAHITAPVLQDQVLKLRFQPHTPNILLRRLPILQRVQKWHQIPALPTYSSRLA